MVQVWGLGFQQFEYFGKQINGFLGIGSAPEFLENLMWNKFSKKNENRIKKKMNYKSKT